MDTFPSLYLSCIGQLASVPFGKTYLPKYARKDLGRELIRRNDLVQIRRLMRDSDLFRDLIASNVLKEDTLLKVFLFTSSADVERNSLADETADNFVRGYAESNFDRDLLSLGSTLGEVLSDAGLFEASDRVYTSILAPHRSRRLLLTLPAAEEKDRLSVVDRTARILTGSLHVRHSSGQVAKAEESHRDLLRWTNLVRATYPEFNSAVQMGELACFESSRGNFDEALRWSLRAVEETDDRIAVGKRIDIYLGSIRACIKTKNFERIEHAMELACRDFASEFRPEFSHPVSLTRVKFLHPVALVDATYARILREYAFCMLHRHEMEPRTLVGIMWRLYSKLYRHENVLQFFVDSQHFKNLLDESVKIFRKVFGKTNALSIAFEKEVNEEFRTIRKRPSFEPKTKPKCARKLTY